MRRTKQQKSRAENEGRERRGGKGGEKGKGKGKMAGTMQNEAERAADREKGEIWKHNRKGKGHSAFSLGVECCQPRLIIASTTTC